jgi:Protein O-mannosyl-transferase TMEM260-like
MIGRALWCAAAAAAVLAVYSATLARDLTWQNGGGDGAELATAAYVGGVGHPPGYPLYLSALRLAQLAPVGTTAFRSNAFSAGAAALAAVMLGATVVSLLGVRSGDQHLSAYAGATFGAAVFAFAPLVWSQAVVTEVYTFEAALFALFLLGAAAFVRQPSNARLLLASGSLGLLVSHHPPFAVAVLPLTWLGWTWSRDWRTCLVAGLLPLLIGIGVLGIVALRASLQPWLSWGDATTFGDWIAQVSAASYHDYFLSATLSEDAQRSSYAAATLIRQGGWLALGCAALGLSWLWQQWRPVAVLCGSLAVVFAAFAVLYNANDSIVYLLPVVTVLALGAGLGAAWLLRLLDPKAASLLACALVASVGWQVLAGWPSVDASRDQSARSWATQRLEDAPQQGVVHVRAEEQLFVLWYLQGVERVRPDVVVVDDRLLATRWFCSQLQRQHPDVRDCELGSRALG